MEPKLPAPNFQSEQPPVLHERGKEVAGGVIPEAAPERAPERVGERPIETTTQIPAAPALPPPVAAPDPQVQSISSAPQPIVGQDDMPLVAADEDLIEKEWVDKAKKIIEATKDDPYKREQEVGKLQADYLRKRYGKELGAA